MITNKLNLPQPFVDAVSREYEYKPKQYSVTSLLKGTRETILQRRHHKEIIQDVADMVWLIFGTAVHSVFENTKDDFFLLKENKVILEMQNGYKLSGIFDLYDFAAQKVTDWKTAAVWKVIYNDWEDYRKQLLIYCYMQNKKGLPATEGEIVALLKDHSKTKAKFESGYPQHPVYKIGWKFTKEEFADIENWLFAKFKEIEEQEKLPDNELILCTPEERWSEPTTYAVMKQGNKRAIKVYESKEEAEARAAELGLNYYVEERQGIDKKCSEYCSCCDFCNYYQEKYGGNENE